MTKRQLSTSPLSSRSSKESKSQSVTSPKSDHTPGPLAFVSSGSRGPSPTHDSSDVRSSTPKQISGQSTGARSASPLSSAPTSVPSLDTKSLEKTHEMLAPLPATPTSTTNNGLGGLLTPESRASKNDGTVVSSLFSIMIIRLQVSGFCQTQDKASSQVKEMP
jgi:hypothetical protein